MTELGQWSRQDLPRLGKSLKGMGGTLISDKFHLFDINHRKPAMISQTPKLPLFEMYECDLKTRI